MIEMKILSYSAAQILFSFLYSTPSAAPIAIVSIESYLYSIYISTICDTLVIIHTEMKNIFENCSVLQLTKKREIVLN